MLNSLSSLWPFVAWGIDIIGEIRLNTSNGNKYIVVAIDYFSRWIEAESFGTLKARQMAKFIEKSLICRYGVPHHIVIDNGVQFQAKTAELLQRYGIEHHKSLPYRLQANGQSKQLI